MLDYQLNGASSTNLPEEPEPWFNFVTATCKWVPIIRDVPSSVVPKNLFSDHHWTCINPLRLLYRDAVSAASGRVVCLLASAIRLV